MHASHSAKRLGHEALTPTHQPDRKKQDQRATPKKIPKSRQTLCFDNPKSPGTGENEDVKKSIQGLLFVILL